MKVMKSVGRINKIQAGEKYEKMKLKNMKNTLKLLRNLVVQSFEITWKELSWNGLD